MRLVVTQQREGLSSLACILAMQQSSLSPAFSVLVSGGSGCCWRDIDFAELLTGPDDC